MALLATLTDRLEVVEAMEVDGEGEAHSQDGLHSDERHERQGRGASSLGAGLLRRTGNTYSIF